MYGLSRQVAFGDRFNYFEMFDLPPGICSPWKQVESHGSILSRQVSLYQDLLGLKMVEVEEIMDVCVRVGVGVGGGCQIPGRKPMEVT